MHPRHVQEWLSLPVAPLLALLGKERELGASRWDGAREEYFYHSTYLDLQLATRNLLWRFFFGTHIPNNRHNHFPVDAHGRSRVDSTVSEGQFLSWHPHTHTQMITKPGIRGIFTPTPTVAPEKKKQCTPTPRPRIRSKTIKLF